MEIFNKNSMDALYSIISDLANEIPIYKWSMDEDENSIPDSYILLRSDVTDNTKTFGDGKSLIRNSDCDIMLISKGNVTSSKELHNQNIQKIKDLLKSKEISYYGSDLGYDSSLNSSQYTFSLTVSYCG